MKSYNKIGIWGLGVLGKSALNYFYAHGAQLEVIDNKELSPADRCMLTDKGIPYYQQEQDLSAFLERNDRIIPSSGIDLRAYSKYQHKWLPELDFFYAQWRKPIVAITGTVGKTSTTQILGQLLNAHGLQACVGGNIGVGLFDMLGNSQDSLAVLELSSFQLELSTTFAPDLAIWTNFFPNHLDRHSTAQEYFDAKYKIISAQQAHQKALLPLTVFNSLQNIHRIMSELSLFMLGAPTPEQCNTLRSHKLFYMDNDAVMLVHTGTHHKLIARDQLPAVSFPENWLIICAALQLLGVPLSIINTAAETITLPEHRLEKVATHRGIEFYNDSKSTTAEATVAAVNRLQGKPIHLLLGGISKGVDRAPLIQQLIGKVARVYCFGKEAEQLQNMCKTQGISCSSHTTLEDALDVCHKKTRPQEIVLLSPAGASFDLFANYMARGQRFKELVAQLVSA